MLINLFQPESIVIYVIVILLLLFRKYGPPRKVDRGVPKSRSKVDYDNHLLDEEL